MGAFRPLARPGRERSNIAGSVRTDAILKNDLASRLDNYGDLPISIHVEVDRTFLTLAEVLGLKAGQIVTLSKPAGEPLDIYAGGVLLGYGEVMVLNGNLGVRVTAQSGGKKFVAPQTAGTSNTPFRWPLRDTPQQFRESPILERLLDDYLSVGVVMGRAWLPLERVLRLLTGSFLELQSTLHEPVEIVVHERVIAHGEVVVTEGNYGVRILSIVLNPDGEPVADELPATIH